jgi:hypothetical protein
VRLDILEADFNRCGISPEIHAIPFTNWKGISRTPGLYSIWAGPDSIYVGQGGGSTGIRDLFYHHYAKAFDIAQAGTSHSRAWQWARQHNAHWDPLQWTVEFFYCASPVHRTYLEGAMLLLFNPLCNDETHENRLLSL